MGRRAGQGVGVHSEDTSSLISKRGWGTTSLLPAPHPHPHPREWEWEPQCGRAPRMHGPCQDTLTGISVSCPIMLQREEKVFCLGKKWLDFGGLKRVLESKEEAGLSMVVGVWTWREQGQVQGWALGMSLGIQSNTNCQKRPIMVPVVASWGPWHVPWTPAFRFLLLHTWSKAQSVWMRSSCWVWCVWCCCVLSWDFEELKQTWTLQWVVVFSAFQGEEANLEFSVAPGRVLGWVCVVTDPESPHLQSWGSGPPGVCSL